MTDPFDPFARDPAVGYLTEEEAKRLSKMPLAAPAYGGPPHWGRGAVPVEKSPYDAIWELVLLSIDDSRRVETVKALREKVGLGVQEAFEVVRDTPRSVLRDVPRSVAEDAQEALRRCGAQTRVQ